MKNELTELVINSFSKRMGVKGKKANVKRIGKKVIIIPEVNQEYIPSLEINDVDGFEKILQEYLEAVKKVDIKYTKMDERHNYKYFLFNIWKNATNYDYQHPEEFIKRYTNFILDTTFDKYTKITALGVFDEQLVVIRKEEDEYGFETPYIMHLSISDGKNIYNLPWVRYGISENKDGQKVAYIYALQKMEKASNVEYNEKIQKLLNKVNTGVKRYRNVTPSSIAVLGIFLGMLEKEGIQEVRVPDFLIGRYGKFTNTTTEEEIDRVQTNLTDKFMRDFLRLSEQLTNVKIGEEVIDAYNSFLHIKLEQMKECNNMALCSLYNIGRGKPIEQGFITRNKIDDEGR